MRCQDQLGHHVRVALNPDGTGLTEARGKWVLPVEGKTVTQIRIDQALTLLVDWIEIRIESPFSYGAPDSARQFDPADTPGLAPLLGLYLATLMSGEIRKDGRLTIVFADGSVLVVLPDERYEAFTVAGSLPPIHRGFHFVAIPGGGLARF